MCIDKNDKEKSELQRFHECEYEACVLNSFFSIMYKSVIVTVIMIKMPFKTKHFNKNQKVWVQITTGAMAAKVVGRYRKKYRSSPCRFQCLRC